MKWQGRRGSKNVRDQRGKTGGGIGGGGGNLIMALLSMVFRGGITKTKIILVLVVFGIFYFVGNPLDLLSPSSGISPNQAQYDQPAVEKDELYQFVEVVVADTEDVWNKLFSEHGADYREPQLIVFNRAIRSGCGGASSATGPFYCPADQSVYIDLSFYQDLSNRFGAPGDFAMAYVVAHEIGHHVQHLMGTTDKVHSARGSLSEEDYNKLSVRLELQADFYAGVWAHHAQEMFNILEDGDIDEALRAANAIGDDKLQKQTQGQVTPDSFTHGTSEQRVRWFRKGFESGDMTQGDTFNTNSL
ncbi:MAG: metalloprotease [Cyclobacteriaceae bacterium]|nr:MAG: metalloprotease [Cyclobacteriaceae bacterium]